MAQGLVVALGMIAATAALPPTGNVGTTGAPAGTATTRYCLRVDPPTGSRIETIQCRTREDWADLDVDVDQEWAANGVKVLA
jgi:hypothetical protein